MTMTDVIDDMFAITDDWNCRHAPGWVWELTYDTHDGPMTPYGEQMVEIAEQFAQIVAMGPPEGMIFKTEGHEDVGPSHKCPVCGITWDCGIGDDCEYEHLLPCKPCQRKIMPLRKDAASLWEESGLRLVEL